MYIDIYKCTGIKMPISAQWLPLRREGRRATGEGKTEAPVALVSLVS